MDKITFGQEIMTSHKLERISEFKHWRNRSWEPTPIKETKVYIIGQRTLWNGYVNGDGDEGFFFVGSKQIKAFLVVKNLNTKPFYILRNENK
jgi:hypothetical protein